MCVLTCFSPVQLSVTVRTVAPQAPLSVGLSRQEYWTGLPCPPPGELADPGMQPVSTALQAEMLYFGAAGEAPSTTRLEW